MLRLLREKENHINKIWCGCCEKRKSYKQNMLRLLREKENHINKIWCGCCHKKKSYKQNMLRLLREKENPTNLSGNMWECTDIDSCYHTERYPKKIVVSILPH